MYDRAKKKRWNENTRSWWDWCISNHATSPHDGQPNADGRRGGCRKKRRRSNQTKQHRSNNDPLSISLLFVCAFSNNFSIFTFNTHLFFISFRSPSSVVFFIFSLSLLFCASNSYAFSVIFGYFRFNFVVRCFCLVSLFMLLAFFFNLAGNWTYGKDASENRNENNSRDQKAISLNWVRCEATKNE